MRYVVATTPFAGAGRLLQMLGRSPDLAPVGLFPSYAWTVAVLPEHAGRLFPAIGGIYLRRLDVEAQAVEWANHEGTTEPADVHYFEQRLLEAPYLWRRVFLRWELDPIWIATEQLSDAHRVAHVIRALDARCPDFLVPPAPPQATLLDEKADYRAWKSDRGYPDRSGATTTIGVTGGI